VHTTYIVYNPFIALSSILPDLFYLMSTIYYVDIGGLTEFSQAITMTEVTEDI